jgi:hypothetical protein
MIVLKLCHSGLGNQLFNYAAARTLADIRRTALVLDCSLFSPRAIESTKADPRYLEITHFPIRGLCRHTDGMDPAPGVLERISRRVREDLFSDYLNTNTGHFNYLQGFFELSRRTRIDGPLISLRYFEGNSDAIRRDISLDPTYALNLLKGSGLSFEFEKIQRLGGRACMVHARRGDYLSAGWMKLGFDNFESYMRRGMDYLAERIPEATFFCFTDDPAWMSNQLASSKHRIVMVSGKSPIPVVRPIHEFVLMSRCSHFVIANSTFSWWPAWLSERPGKIVVAPARWDPQGVTRIEEMIPSGWVTLDIN